MSSISVNDLPRRVDAAQRVLHTLAASRAPRCAVCRRRIVPGEEAQRADGASVHARCAPGRHD